MKLNTKKILFSFTSIFLTIIAFVCLSLSAEYLLTLKHDHIESYFDVIYRYNLGNHKKVSSYIKERKTTQKGDSKRSKVFLTAGCSFAYGEGLSDEETLASNMSRLSTHYIFKNIGLPGGSIHHFLHDYDKGLLDKYFENKEVIITYGIFFDQIYRSNFTRSGCCTPWGPDIQVKNNRLIYKGHFLDRITSEPTQAFIQYNSIYNYFSEMFFKETKSIIAGEIDKEYQMNFCDLITQANRIAQSRNHNFYVYSYESFINQSHLKKCLQENKVKILDITHNHARRKYRIAIRDYHPNQKYNKIIAKEILELVSNDLTTVEK